MKKRFSLVEREKIVNNAHQCLWTADGKPGFDYLVSQRKLSEDTIRKFRLGYIPLHVEHQLRGRIIFPLYDPSGNLIIVNSRRVVDDGIPLPVYWHESYEKSFYLYGIELSRSSIQKHGFAIVCLDGDQDTINPQTGEVKLIRDIQVGDEMLSYGRSSNSCGKVTNTVFNGYKKCFKIKTDNGREIITTHDHKFYANGRWVKLEDLQLGDLLISPLQYNVKNPKNCLNNLDECRLLGYMIGDGYCVGSPMFTNTNANIVRDFKRLISKLGDRVVQRDDRHYMIYGKQPRGGYKQVSGNCLSNIQKFLDKNKIRNKLAYDKSIPSFMFSASDEYIKEMFSGLFDSDGTVDKKRNAISYSTTSYLLAQQIKLLLLRFAVNSSIRKVFYNNPKHRDGYIVSITGEAAIRLSGILKLRHPVKRRRLKSIFLRRRKKTERCDHLYPVVEYIRQLCIKSGIKFRQLLDQANLSRSSLSRQYISLYHLRTMNAILKDSFLSELASGNIYASRIVSIEECGKKPVYDIEIKLFKNFYINDILVHNCEGQFDVLQLYNHGILNVVGLGGTKFSKMQISVIQRYCDDIVLLMDTDANQAGQRGVEKAIEDGKVKYAPWAQGTFPSPFNVGLTDISDSRNIIPVIFPENCDPDEFVLKFGVDKLKKLIRNKIYDSHN